MTKKLNFTKLNNKKFQKTKTIRLLTSKPKTEISSSKNYEINKKNCKKFFHKLVNIILPDKAK